MTRVAAQERSNATAGLVGEIRQTDGVSVDLG